MLADLKGGLNSCVGQLSVAVTKHWRDLLKKPRNGCFSSWFQVAFSPGPLGAVGLGLWQHCVSLGTWPQMTYLASIRLNFLDILPLAYLGGLCLLVHG